MGPATAAPTRLRFDDLPGLMTRMTGDSKHLPSATSTLDVLWVLYDRVLSVSALTLSNPDRDRFLLSKGHGPMAYYAVLAAKGFLPVAELATFGTYGSRLGHHPDRTLVPGVEISSGSLGHGLGLGVGMALGLRAAGRTRPRVVVLLGDAELDEGSNAEAIAYAGAAQLGRLMAVVIDNGSATHGRPGLIQHRFAADGWAVATVDGRDHGRLESALSRPPGGRPLAVVATVERKER